MKKLAILVLLMVAVQIQASTLESQETKRVLWGDECPEHEQEA